MGSERRLRILGRLHSGEPPLETARLCRVCADLTETDGAGIMLFDGEVSLGSLCATGSVSELIETLQFTLGEGPCIDASRDGRPVLEAGASFHYVVHQASGMVAAQLGVSAAGIMLAGPDGTLRVIASSSEQMRLLELFELQTEQGPCLESFQTGEAVIHDDLATASARWPTFAPEAISSGFRSVHALPMRLRGDVIGALNLFERSAEGIDDEALRAARALADIATIAILQYRATIGSHELIDQLNTALNTRIVIEQAKGVIAERRQLDMESAFAILRHHARNNNLRLSDVAAAIVTGTLRPSSLEHTSRSGRARPVEP